MSLFVEGESGGTKKLKELKEMVKKQATITLRCSYQIKVVIHFEVVHQLWQIVWNNSLTRYCLHIT